MCGSAAASRQTPQIIADVTGCPVACVEAFDASAWGRPWSPEPLVEQNADLAQLAGHCPPITCDISTPVNNAACYQELSRTRYMQTFAVWKLAETQSR